MEVNLNLDKRIHNRLIEYCKANNLVLTEYLCYIIEKQFNIDCFGDLNEKLNPTQIKIVNKYELTIPETEEVTELKKVVRKKRIINSK